MKRWLESSEYQEPKPLRDGTATLPASRWGTAPAMTGNNDDDGTRTAMGVTSRSRSSPLPCLRFSTRPGAGPTQAVSRQIRRLRKLQFVENGHFSTTGRSGTLEGVTVRLLTWAERPDLAERGPPSDAVWPEYNLHGDVFDEWWGPLLEELPEYQFALYDDSAGVVLAEAHTGPLSWNGEDATLPDGIDDALRRIIAEHRAGRPLTRCARSPPKSRPARASAGWPANCWTACASSPTATDCDG